VIGKSLRNLGNVTGILKGDASITSPAFILATNNNYLSGTNYLYWQETGRYYYIDDIELITGGRMVFYCSVDVLESFKTQIKAQTAIVDKQESLSNLYFNDGSFVRDSREFYTVKTFSNGFNDNGEYILITAGA
jgi:hypothetical protein